MVAVVTADGHLVVFQYSPFPQPADASSPPTEMPSPWLPSRRVPCFDFARQPERASPAAASVAALWGGRLLVAAAQAPACRTVQLKGSPFVPEASGVSCQPVQTSVADTQLLAIASVVILPDSKLLLRTASAATADSATPGASWRLLLSSTDEPAWLADLPIKGGGSPSLESLRKSNSAVVASAVSACGTRLALLLTWRYLGNESADARHPPAGAAGDAEASSGGQRTHALVSVLDLQSVQLAVDSEGDGRRGWSVSVRPYVSLCLCPHLCLCLCLHLCLCLCPYRSWLSTHRAMAAAAGASLCVPTSVCASLLGLGTANWCADTSNPIAKSCAGDTSHCIAREQ